MSYAVLAVIVLLLAAGVAVLAGRRAGPGWWVRVAAAAAVLVALTAVFDNLMIALDLYRYAEAGVSGVRLGLAPVEDFAWPLVAALLLPGLWEILGARARGRTAGSQESGTGGRTGDDGPRAPAAGGQAPHVRGRASGAGQADGDAPRASDDESQG